MARLFTDTLPSTADKNDDFSTVVEKIRDYLGTVLPEDVFKDYIENMEFEEIDDKKVVVRYFGDAPLKEFNKNHKQTVFFHICSVAGYKKSFKIYKEKAKKAKPEETKESSNKPNIQAAKLFIISVIFIAFTFMVAVMGFNYIGNRNFKERFYNVGSLKVNSKIRIIEISDLHSVSYGKNNSKLISRVEKLKPDIIIYTGDCLDYYKNTAKELTDLCKKLSEVAPSYYIYGNNEVLKYYNMALTQDALDEKFKFNDKNRDYKKLLQITDALETELEKAGVKVLKNEKDTIKIGTTTVDVYGVLTSNPSAFWSYGGEPFEEYLINDKQNLKITAIHEPLVFEEYTISSWGDVILAGHTHGGIIRLPVIGPLYTKETGILPEKRGSFTYGRHEVSGRPLIISAGLTNKNIFRINNQPELVIVDINRF